MMEVFFTILQVIPRHVQLLPRVAVVHLSVLRRECSLHLPGAIVVNGLTFDETWPTAQVMVGRSCGYN